MWSWPTATISSWSDSARWARCCKWGRTPAPQDTFCIFHLSYSTGNYSWTSLKWPTKMSRVVTKSWTGTWTWDVGRGTRGCGTRGCGDSGMQGRGGARTWNASMHGDSRTWDVGTGWRIKQTTRTWFMRWICKIQFSAVKWKVIGTLSTDDEWDDDDE